MKTKTEKIDSHGLAFIYASPGMLAGCKNPVQLLIEATVFTAVHEAHAGGFDEFDLKLDAKELASLAGYSTCYGRHNPKELKWVVERYGITVKTGRGGTVLHITLANWIAGSRDNGRIVVDASPGVDVPVQIRTLRKIPGKAGILYFLILARAACSSKGLVYRAAYLRSQAPLIFGERSFEAAVSELKQAKALTVRNVHTVGTSGKCYVFKAVTNFSKAGKVGDTEVVEAEAPVNELGEDSCEQRYTAHESSWCPVSFSSHYGAPGPGDRTTKTQ